MKVESVPGVRFCAPGNTNIGNRLGRREKIAMAARRGGKPRSMEVDIHGMSQEQAKKRLEQLLTNAAPSLEELVVIHGHHGGTALRDMVRERLHHRCIAAKLLSLNPGVTRILLKK